MEKNGVYSGLSNVDVWDISRDARLYDGPYPVIAHPPCNRWVNFAALNYKRWGGEHNRPGNDGGCFESALNSVRKLGGVLEHPAGSRAFDAFGISKPSGVGWTEIGPREYVCEIWQSVYGHLARKRTWLFYSGNEPPEQANWTRVPGTHQIGKFDRVKPALFGKRASATPRLFAEYLIRLVGS